MLYIQTPMNQIPTHRHWRWDGSGTPLPPRGLRFRRTSSLDLFYAEGVRTEAGPALEGSPRKTRARAIILHRLLWT